MRRHVLAVVVLASLLAGCGGGHGMHLLPSGQLGQSGGGRGVQSTNSVLFNGTLWYGDDRALYGIPLTNGAPSSEIDGSYAGLVNHQSRAMTIAPDGTLYELIQNNTATVGWQLRIYAPGSHGAAQPEQTISGSGYPQQVVLVVDGIGVLWNSSRPGTGGTATLSTFAFGSGNTSQPIRTLSLGTDVTDVAADGSNRIYVARNGGSGVAVYSAGATCTCAPIRTIATGLQVERSIAVARDGTVYVLTRDPKAETSYVDAYAPGNNGPAASRTLGPFYENMDVAANGIVSSPTGGITVDSAGDLYIGFSDGGGHVRVEMYTSNATGTAGPARTIATPAFSTYLTSIAIGPATPSAIVPTLYVASGSQILAFAGDASGTAAPKRTIGGFWQGTNRASNVSSVLRAIATAADGTLDALVYKSGQQVGDRYCEIDVFAADANGPVQGSNAAPYCNGERGRAVSRGVDGELDFLIDTHLSTVVRRVVNGVPAGSFTPNTGYGHNAIAVAPDGRISLTAVPQAGDGAVETYPANAVDPANPVYFNLQGSLGAACYAPNGTLYVTGEIAASGGGTPTDYVYVVPRYPAPMRTIGPFGNHVSALACGAGSEVYVGITFWSGAGSWVKVFGPNAGMGDAPVRTLMNPIPANDPSGQTIVSLAVSP